MALAYIFLTQKVPIPTVTSDGSDSKIEVGLFFNFCQILMIFQRLAAPFSSMLHYEKNHQICQKIEKKLVPYRLKKITALPKPKIQVLVT